MPVKVNGVTIGGASAVIPVASICTTISSEEYPEFPMSRAPRLAAARGHYEGLGATSRESRSRGRRGRCEPDRQPPSSANVR